ncbi:MAG: DUF1673 family protein [Candidatus Methanoperedenaceae archaeon]|nr:DUF1673 family protein [Candidatus Methanoperedenaceae archaeon]
MTINVMKSVRKLMGWCPNASTIDARKTVQFDDLAVNAPDSGGELTHIPAGWWNKYRNRILYSSFILTLFAIYFFTLSGKDNMNPFLAGLIVGVLSSIIFWVFEWRRLNKAAAGEFKSMQVTRRKKVINYLIIFGLVAVIIFVTAFLLVKTEIRIRGFYAFLSGLFLFVWTQYFEVLYWERKNRKTLIVDKTSFYAVDIDAG